MNELTTQDFKTLKSLVPKITQELQQRDLHIIQTAVVPEARIYAKNKLPRALDSNIHPYIAKLHALYTALKHETAVKVRGSLQRFTGALNMAHYATKIKATADAILQVQHKRDNLEIDASRIAAGGRYKAYKRHGWLLYVFGFAESLINLSCFLRIGDIIIVAGVIGIVVGLAQVYAAKMVVLNIREIADPARERRCYLWASLGFFLVSMILGMLRYHFVPVAVVAQTPFYILNPFFFALVNFLFAFAAGLVVHFFYPRKAELQELEQLRSIEQRIKKCDEEIQTLKSEHEHLINEKLAVATIHAQLLHDEARLSQMIDELYKSAVGSFISENLIKREDGVVPACFSHPLDPLPMLNTDFLHK